MSAALQVSDADMSPFARFAVVDNDGGGTVGRCNLQPVATRIDTA